MKILTIPVLLLICSLVAIQCKNDNPNAERTLPSKEINPTLSKENYLKSKTPATASKYITDVIKVAMADESDMGKKRQLLSDAITVAEESKSNNLKGSLLNTYIKILGPNDNPARVLELATLLKGAGKTQASDVLLYGYTQIEDSNLDISTATSLMSSSSKISNVDDHIASLRNAISVNPNKFSINEDNARTYVDACEAYAMVMPKAENTPRNLFNAAEVAKSLKSFNKSFALFDWLREKYPEHPKSATGLFLKGFILENELKNDNGAKVFYEEFLEAYPDHDLADDVEFLLSNLGKSNEEILKMIESKKQSSK